MYYRYVEVGVNYNKQKKYAFISNAFSQKFDFDVFSPRDSNNTIFEIYL